MEVKEFGSANVQKIYLYTLTNKNNLSVTVTNYGARVVSLMAPDKTGNFADVVLGYDNLESYQKDETYFGAIVGRYANRIKGGVFTIDDVLYELDKDDAGNCTHSGPDGFHQAIWFGQAFEDKVVFTYLSQDGHQKFPGNLVVKVTYSLDDENRFDIQCEATSDKKTPLNIINHTYFNLGGHTSGSIENHELFIDADEMTPLEAASYVPTGEFVSVEGTPMDFREYRRIGDGLVSDYEQIQIGNGYDINFQLNHYDGSLQKVSSLRDPKSGRKVDVYTDRPGMNIYTANFLNGEIGKDGVVYKKRDAICLEMQGFPNAVNEPAFPNSVVDAGEVYKTHTVYQFVTE